MYVYFDETRADMTDVVLVHQSAVLVELWIFAEFDGNAVNELLYRQRPLGRAEKNHDSPGVVCRLCFNVGQHPLICLVKGPRKRPKKCVQASFASGTGF
jgi:hypothetical protein